MIELLIALLILAVGLFGTASLMMTSMQSNQSAAARSQASWLAYDIIERMRLNSAVATGTDNYVIAAAAGVPADPGCKANGCTANNVAALDLFEWKTQLVQSNLTGAIARAGNAYTVSIFWQEDSSTACPLVLGVRQCSFVLRAAL
ncbi:type IV pilus modification protein PilV [Pseudomonas benzenivorans]|uniref:Type IV pilus modification protein PilV n=1 Tax=Pseudomonas benzenivorans TaxID=556533 RepID=A0ABY5H5J0_9PSED|nr:type IV pilus modification protein PilV [Pseudomonas benzenivorans]UTW06692.1 type IV pilus modification protein PilV [Pseudomonas benzenivorans]